MESAVVPAGDSWCYAGVVADPIGEGDWQITWQVFGIDDPRFK